MEFADIAKQLDTSKEFKVWRKENPKPFLAHAFKLLDEANQDTWQLGYYDAEKENITTFIVSALHVEVIPNQEILRSPNAIEPLEVKHIKIESEQILKQSREYHQLHHPRELVLKQFFIIQQINAETVYNVTFFFQSMKTLNLKFDAKDGKLLSNSFQTLMEMDKPLK